MCITKDVAKVISGAAFVEILNHISLAVGNILPLHFFGMTITPTYNLVILFSWIVVGTVSVYYAWIRKQPTMFDRLSRVFTK